MKTVRTALFGALMLIVGFLLATNSGVQAFAAAVCATATPTITPTLPAILPTAADDQGTRDNPIPLNTTHHDSYTVKGVEYRYDVSVSQVSFGPKVVTQLAKIYDPAPDPEKTYLIALVTATYISGPKDTAGDMATGDFQSLSNGQLSGTVYVVPPSPKLDFKGFPGAKFKGWIVLTIDATDTEPLIVWGASSDGSGGIYFATH